MTKKFGTHALVLAGLLVAASASGYAQSATASQVRRVPAAEVKSQPIAPATVIMSSSMTLSAQQRATIAAMAEKATALQTERARLWSEYRSLKITPNVSDNIAIHEAAPRMLRIVKINEQLAPIVAEQQKQIGSILSATQRDQLARLMTDATAQL